MRLAQPSRGQGIHVQNFQSRILSRSTLENFLRSVLRPIIHSHHFIPRIIQRQQRFERARQFFSLVARRK